MHTLIDPLEVRGAHRLHAAKNGLCNTTARRGRQGHRSVRHLHSHSTDLLTSSPSLSSVLYSHNIQAVPFEQQKVSARMGRATEGAWATSSTPRMSRPLAACVVCMALDSLPPPSLPPPLVPLTALRRQHRLCSRRSLCTC